MTRTNFIANRIRELNKFGVKFYVSSAPEGVSLFPPERKSVVLRTWMEKEQVEKIITKAEQEWRLPEPTPFMKTLDKLLGSILRSTELE
jgi:hypothetical protein